MLVGYTIECTQCRSGWGGMMKLEEIDKDHLAEMVRRFVELGGHQGHTVQVELVGSGSDVLEVFENKRNRVE